MHRDPYDVLGIARDTSLDDAEDAYHEQMRREHPDVHQNAGPDRLATAELRTRELNAAISAIRDQAANTAAGKRVNGASTGGHGNGNGTGQSGHATSTSSATADDRSDASDGAGGWSPADDEPTTATCPWCGQTFARATELKDHVFGEHDLRLDRRERGSLLGGRVHRLGRKAAHLPLWGVIPINLTLAVVIALLVTSVTDETIGLWAAVITMAPTAVALLDRLFDFSG